MPMTIDGQIQVALTADFPRQENLNSVILVLCRSEYRGTHIRASHKPIGIVTIPCEVFVYYF